MSKHETCPHCGVSLRGDQILGEIDDNGEPRYYSRTIGVEIWGVYDGVLFWQCPDCSGRWHRWSPEDARGLYRIAATYVDRIGGRDAP